MATATNSNTMTVKTIHDHDIISRKIHDDKSCRHSTNPLPITHLLAFADSCGIFAHNLDRELSSLLKPVDSGAQASFSYERSRMCVRWQHAFHEQLAKLLKIQPKKVT